MKQTDRKHELVSVTKLITSLFGILMALIIGLTMYYAALLIRSSYVNCHTLLQKSAEKGASEINEAISTLDKQIEWLSRISGDSAIWNSNSAYEDMLWKSRLTNNLQDFLVANTGVDAVIIAKRNDIALLESHTVSESVFFRLVDICNGQRAITPKSMNFFCENGADFSHLIFSKSIYNGNSNRIVANIYTLIRLDALIPPNNEGEIQLLSLKDNGGHNIISVQGSSNADIGEWERVVNAGAGKRVITIDGVRYFQEWLPLDQPDWYLACLQPANIFLKSMTKSFAVVVALLIGVFALLIGGERIILRQIRIPLSDMLSDIERIREKGYYYRLGKGKTQEFSQVADSFNDLLDDLNNQTSVIINQQKKLYEIQLLQKESQLISLQSQIKPHFLYNTLECVLSIARHHRIPEIIKIVNGMISIYRYSTVATQNGTVESEFECARMYADIMNTRSKDRYQFEFHVSDELNKCIMPKMILQPLVENAVNHGISKRTRTGRVVIRCSESSGIIRITVWDDGKGISQQRLDEIKGSISGDIRPSDSIGLYNISTRLKIKYGAEFGLNIESEEDVYTMVTVSFPKEVE